MQSALDLALSEQASRCCKPAKPWFLAASIFDGISSPKCLRNVRAAGHWMRSA
jgi:hypothetical protein